MSYMKCSVSPTLKRGGSPTKVNKALCLPHTEKGDSPAKVNRSMSSPHRKWGFTAVVNWILVEK